MIVDATTIKKAKEKLGDKNAELIIKALHVENYDAKNKKACCPFHDEDTPSFIYNNKAHNFHCFGCSKTVDLLDALMLDGKTFVEATSELFELADINYSFGEHKVKTQRDYKYPKEVPLGDKKETYEYLKTRHISEATADYLDIRQDGKGNMVFNYYDTNDVLTTVKYRPHKRIQKGEIKTWCQPEADTTPILFNMNRINPSKPLLITSGELDCASAIEAGYTNAVSIPFGDQNTHWVRECWDFLEQFPSIIICHDNDSSGIKYSKEIMPRLGSWRCKIAQVPEFFTKNSGEKVPIKDLNQTLVLLGKEKVLDLILNAQDTPIPSVQDFSDVEDIDLSDIDGIYTNIKEIDKSIMRLFFGTLNLVSGKPGSGKTSFLSQLACQALDQDYNTWMYSRELPAYMAKNWINFILSGNRHLKKYQDYHGAEYFKVTPEAKKKIDGHYRGRLYFYKDEYDNAVDLIESSMIDSARKYGCKLFIIDNLTTINLHSNDSDKYEKQTEFVNRLIQFAMRYNVCVILVVHPKKLNEENGYLDMYDLSGTSNLPNLAHRTFGMNRITPQQKEGILKQNGTGWKTEPIEYDVVINVIKDRMRGVNGVEFGLHYDKASRRFYSSPEEYDWQYAWDDNIYQDQLLYPIDVRANQMFNQKAEEDEDWGE